MVAPATYTLLFALLSLPMAAQSAQSSRIEAAALPDAPSTCTRSIPAADVTASEAHAYVALTRRQKAARWAHYSYSPYTFSSVLLNASWAHMAHERQSYGSGAAGFARRYGTRLADIETRGFFKLFLLPTLLHQDPRYFRSPKKGVKARAWYAVTRVLITRNDDGHNEFNTSEVAGTAFAAALTNAYYPDQDRGFDRTMRRMSGTLVSGAGSYLLREFWPDIRRLSKKRGSEKQSQPRVPRLNEGTASQPAEK